MKSAKRCRGLCSISEFSRLTDKEEHQTDLLWVEQEDVIPELFKWIQISAAVVLPVPCAHLVLHSSFREKTCQKLALQNTGLIFSSLGLYTGQARETSKLDRGSTWLCLVPNLT